MSLITPDFGLLVWMTLIFGIVFFVLAKWGFPLITRMVDERSDRISSSIEKARKAEESLSQLAEKQQELIDATRKQQAELLREASEARDKIIASAKEQASAEAASLIAEARTKIEAEKEDALRQIRGEVARLSVKVAGKVLLEDLSGDEAQMRLVDRIIDTIGDRSLDAS